MTIARLLRMIRITLAVWLTAEVGLAAQSVGTSREESSVAVSDHHLPAAAGKAFFAKTGETEEEAQSHSPVILGSDVVAPFPLVSTFTFSVAPHCARHFLRHLALYVRPPPALS